MATSSVFKAIADIRPDSDNPRRTFSDEYILGLSESIKTEGIINPIEIDEQSVIITGECRFRAAKLAGLTQVPVTINTTKFTKYEKLRRQVIENIRQGEKTTNSMDPIDTAYAFKKLIKLIPFSDEDRKRYFGSKRVKLASELGVNSSLIANHTAILDQPQFVRDDIQKGRPLSFYAVGATLPESIRERLQRKIANNGFNGRAELRAEVSLLRNNPAVADLLLKRRSPHPASINKLLSQISITALHLERSSIQDVPTSERELVASQIMWLGKKLVDYLKNNSDS